jgi:DNA adenine methylase
VGDQRLTGRNTPLGKPFLKWPGGKRWLCPTISRLVADLQYDRYFEPFLGGGAVYFAIQPKKGVLSDINSELINVYQHVKRCPNTLIDELKKIPVTSEVYGAYRADRPKTKVRRAIRFLFLNRTAFSGMYRVNQKGEFNVPFGGGQRTPDVLWHSNLLTDAASALKTAEVKCTDFENALKGARSGDLVFCDPTYTVTHNNNGFVRYNESNFKWADQVRLAKVCSKLRTKGITVIVSNAFHREVRALYSGATVIPVERTSTLCPSPDKRGLTQEYLFVLYP